MKTWEEFPQAFICYAFVNRGLLTLEEGARALKVSKEAMEEHGDALYEEMQKAIHLHLHNGKYCLNSWDDLRAAKRKRREAEKVEKRIKKEARKNIEHTSKHAYDYHDQARVDDI